jgi:ADP-heptose:LPS heptosyltransferase
MGEPARLTGDGGRRADDPRSSTRLLLLRLVGPLLARSAERRAPASAAGWRSGPGRPRLLLIRPDHLGDALLAAPAGLALRRALPDARIEWLVGPWSAEVVARATAADAILTCEFPGFTRRPKGSPWAPYAELVRQARRLRDRDYDAALVLRPDHWWGAMLAAAAGIRERLGYAVAECRPFLTAALPPAAIHASEQSLGLARLAATRFGAEVAAGGDQPRFAIDAAERAWAAALAARASTRPGAPLVAIHPGSGAAVKNWLPERWRAVASEIAATTEAVLVLTGGAAEGPFLEEVARGLVPRPITLAGQTSLGQLAALFERCALVLGGDSGPLHLAAAVGSPTVRLYGPTDPAVFGPRGDPGRQRVLQAGLPCQPCGNIVAPPCGAQSTPACLRVIGVEQVTAAAWGMGVGGRRGRCPVPQHPTPITQHLTPITHHPDADRDRR